MCLVNSSRGDFYYYDKGNHLNIRPYSRTERFGNELRKLLGELISKELDTSSVGLITITNVKMSNDLKIA